LDGTKQEEKNMAAMEVPNDYERKDTIIHKNWYNALSFCFSMSMMMTMIRNLCCLLCVTSNHQQSNLRRRQRRRRRLQQQQQRWRGQQKSMHCLFLLLSYHYNMLSSLCYGFPLVSTSTAKSRITESSTSSIRQVSYQRYSSKGKGSKQYYYTSATHLSWLPKLSSSSLFVSSSVTNEGQKNMEKDEDNGNHPTHQFQTYLQQNQWLMAFQILLQSFQNNHKTSAKSSALLDCQRLHDAILPFYTTTSIIVAKDYNESNQSSIVLLGTIWNWLIQDHFNLVNQPITNVNTNPLQPITTSWWKLTLPIVLQIILEWKEEDEIYHHLNDLNKLQTQTSINNQHQNSDTMSSSFSASTWTYRQRILEFSKIWLDTQPATTVTTECYNLLL
jgi:hypothetical protein